LSSIDLLIKSIILIDYCQVLFSYNSLDNSLDIRSIYLLYYFSKYDKISIINK